MTRPAIERLRALLAEATPGPWKLYDSNSWRRIGLQKEYREILWPVRTNDGIADFSGRNREADLALIIAAVNSLPALLAAAERYQLLRDGGTFEHNGHSGGTYTADYDMLDHVTGDELDSAIDAALARKER